MKGLLIAVALWAIVLAGVEAKSLKKDVQEIVDEAYGGAKGALEFFRRLERECDIDIKDSVLDGGKVTVDEMKELFTGIASYTSKMAMGFTNILPAIDALDEYPASDDASKAEYLLKHAELLRTFFSRAFTAGASPLCDERLISLYIRFNLFGTDGFKDEDRCHKFSAKMYLLLRLNDFSLRKAADSLTPEDLESLRADMRADMRCMIGFIENFGETAQGLRSLSEDWSQGQLHISIEAVRTYSRLLAEKTIRGLQASLSLTLLSWMVEGPDAPALN